MPYTGAKVLERNRELLDAFLGRVEEGDAVSIAYSMGAGFHTTVNACGELDDSVTVFDVYRIERGNFPRDPIRNARRAVKTVVGYIEDEVRNRGGDPMYFGMEPTHDLDLTVRNRIYDTRKPVEAGALLDEL